MEQAITVQSAPPLAEPRREIRSGLILIVFFFVVLVGWAAIAHLDAAAYAQGTLVVSGQRQSVQHREGGVVGEILVHEGQRVRQGELLIRLNAADVVAEERALTTQAIRLLARRGRLEAEESGAASVRVPPEMSDVAANSREEAQAAIRVQQDELNARRALLAAQRGSVGERVSQAGQQGEGFRRQMQASQEQMTLLDQELASLRPLAARGFVSQTRIRELERARAELEGRRGQYDYSSRQYGDAAQESRLQVLAADRTFRERTMTQRAEVDDSLATVLPRLAAARVQLARTEIRSPATGTVVGLTVFTPGGVIAAGQKLMEIVPESVPLRVDARIAPDDADDLAQGQRVLVRMSGLHERSLPDLEGSITRLSADSFTDEHTQQQYFTAEILIPDDQVALIRDVRGASFELRPGMPVEVLIPLRDRTALQYLFEPLINSLWRSFREH
jgi:HlyD family type I secretion membrane fusion protein